jgi:glyoxylase-like metal-dependent hydrolase (beta-lactamase superfamily II)
MHLVDITLTFWVASRLGKPNRNLWYSPHLKPDYRLTDQNILPGFADWCVLITSGHKDRYLSVLHKPTKRMYVADLIVKVKTRFIPPIPVYYPEQYLASLLRVKNLALNSVILAHGGEVTLTEHDFEHLFTVAPRKPKTIWASAKNRMKRLTMRKSTKPS